MEEKLEIFYIRHAETDPPRLESASTCDVCLSETGYKQIALLGERFAGKQFDAIFSSPLVRAVRTAAAVAERLDNPPPIEIMTELIENGSRRGYVGNSIEFLRSIYPDMKMCPDTLITEAYDDEDDDVNDWRAKIIVDYFRKRFGYGKKIAVFAHGSFGNHFIPAAVEMGKGNYILSINHTSVTKIKYTTDGKQRISFQNDISHLRSLMPDYEFTV